MKISLKGYGENTATFKTNSVITAGEPVCITDNFTVDLCQANDDFIGAAVNAKDGYACVQLDGYVRFTYSGSAPVVGLSILTANGTGGVRISETGRQFTVTDVDTSNNTVGIIL